MQNLVNYNNIGHLSTKLWRKVIEVERTVFKYSLFVEGKGNWLLCVAHQLTFFQGWRTFWKRVSAATAQRTVQ